MFIVRLPSVITDLHLMSLIKMDLHKGPSHLTHLLGLTSDRRPVINSNSYSMRISNATKKKQPIIQRKKYQIK